MQATTDQLAAKRRNLERRRAQAHRDHAARIAAIDKRIAELDALDPPMRRLGKNFGHARRQSGLTQTMLARIAGLHPSTISRLERGDYQRGPTIDTVVGICRTRGASADRLLRL